MLLGFKEQHNGVSTLFVPKILAGMQTNDRLKSGRDFKDFQTDYWCGVYKYKDRPKIHTIRADDGGRWKAGATIHFATGVRTKHTRLFATGACTEAQDIVLRMSASDRLMIGLLDNGFRSWKDRWKVLTEEQELQFALNDGFDTWQAFDDWFRPLVVKEGGRLDRKLIHWADFRY